MGRRQDIESWASGQPWRDIGAVVIIGWIPEAIEVLRMVRKPIDVIFFDPEDAGEDGDDYSRVTHLDSIRNKLGQRRFPHWQIAVLCPPENEKRWYKPVHEQVVQGEQFAQCRHLTMLSNVEKWTEIGLDLLPEYAGKTPIQALAGVAKGRDGLIVGAGPSLNQAMFWLPTVQDRIVICAVEAALPVLERGGVKPDFVVAVEAQAGAFEGLGDLELWKDAILVPGIHAHRKAWELPAKRICPAIQGIGPFGHWLIDSLGLAPLESGGSVATVCYSVLRAIGCEVICGVGIDSAYGQESNMQAYADGVGGGDSKQKQPRCLERLEAFGGVGKVASSPQLKAYRDWFGVMARQQPDRGHINLSVGGARIPGWREMELCDWTAAVEDHCEPCGPLDIPDCPIDLEWTIAALEDQLAGAHRAMAIAESSLELTDKWVDCMKTLGSMPHDPNARMVAGLQMSPLNQMSLLPGPNEMAAAKRVNLDFLERCRRFTPLIERAIERMREKYARAA